MPNWCDNTLTIRGSKETIDGIEKVVVEDGENKLLQHLAPIGEWDYDKAVSQWGTKWDVSVMTHERVDDQTIEMCFDSAWSPPLKAYETWLDTQTDDAASITAHYFEPGMGFAGYYENGIDEYYEWSTKEELNEVPEFLRDHFGIDEWFDDLEEEEDDA